MQATTKMNFGFYFVWTLYAVIFIPTVYFGVEALLPCESNFEGGCGMGKTVMQLLTLIPAVVLSAIGLSLSAFDTTRDRGRLIPKAALYLPVAYLCSVVGLWTIAFLGVTTVFLAIAFALFIMFVIKLK